LRYRKLCRVLSAGAVLTRARNNMAQCRFNHGVQQVEDLARGVGRGPLTLPCSTTGPHRSPRSACCAPPPCASSPQGLRVAEWSACG
jgi:hypothetical protein